MRSYRATGGKRKTNRNRCIWPISRRNKRTHCPPKWRDDWGQGGRDDRRRTQRRRNNNRNNNRNNRNNRNDQYNRNNRNDY